MREFKVGELYKPGITQYMQGTRFDFLQYLLTKRPMMPKLNKYTEAIHLPTLQSTLMHFAK